MKNLTLENITKVCNGIYHGPQEKLQEEVTAITTDSRKVEKGGLFVPVGPRGGEIGRAHV